MKGFGAVSFSGETRAGPFYDQIHSGRKTLTLRERRKDGRPHVKPGYSFNMYWKIRTRMEKKKDLPIYYIGMAECVAYEPVKIVDHWNDEEFAKSDGFADLEEFRDNWYPEWRVTPWINDVIEAYEYLKEKDHIVDRLILPSALQPEAENPATYIVQPSSQLKLGAGASIMAFLQLEYMMIKWKHPLLEKGELHG